ncbi:hypothetical protein PAXRUDRAFT_831425 [Paxillus rubicundulus Ve08.2h10]|uniref:Uncharacterized protein n=1 Tax=Paxillus rubicundulus Ve08.2h10 TaxID=930991 RepID=A0A0D0E1Y4_9AGAM|nr:hypothetical protein PAXRUDRAFT_831425 [Paxillus rubicundulus Ve08.2h10]
MPHDVCTGDSPLLFTPALPSIFVLLKGSKKLFFNNTSLLDAHMKLRSLGMCTAFALQEFNYVQYLGLTASGAQGYMLICHNITVFKLALQMS